MSCRCPLGWSGLETDGKARCYKGMCGPSSWTVAQVQCQEYNGTLVTVDSAEVGLFVRKLVGNVNAVWTGLTTINASSNSWRWVNGDNTSQYTAWSSSSAALAVENHCGLFGFSNCGTSWSAASCQVCGISDSWRWGGGGVKLIHQCSTCVLCPVGYIPSTAY